MIGRTCSTCTWWKAELYEEELQALEKGSLAYEGECHRYPPTFFPETFANEKGEEEDTLYTHWVETAGDDFCGEWALREEPLVALRGKADLALLFEGVENMTDEDFQKVFSSLKTDERISLYHGCFTDEEREAGTSTATFRERLAVYLPFYLSLDKSEGKE